jgi:Tol biopolymer transport system component
MKKTIIAISILWAIGAQGQIMHVTSIEPLDISRNDGSVTQAVAISPQGDYLLLSTDTKHGLVKWDFTTHTTTTVTNDEGAGADVRISDDGRQIVYDQVSYKDRRRQHAVKSIDLLNGKQQTLVKATRKQQGFDVDHGMVVTVTDGQVKKHTLIKGANQSVSRPALTRHHLKLYITRDNQTTMLAPNGENERYIWASLSPDGSRVLYYVSGRGTFVCDTDGNNVIPMGDLTAPKWWDNSTIVGMSETDNEYTVIASSIVARTLDGQQQVLTGSDVIATYPLPSPESGKIAFSTPDGRIYFITVED